MGLILFSLEGRSKDEGVQHKSTNPSIVIASTSFLSVNSARQSQGNGESFFIVVPDLIGNLKPPCHT
ncbi:MAG: hypothetical protein PHY28_10580, partial [Dehalococcoidales bacterium]|nr:hypothetical protein [Dehalococcoidales bacterium]